MVEAHPLVIAYSVLFFAAPAAGLWIAAVVLNGWWRLLTAVAAVLATGLFLYVLARLVWGLALLRVVASRLHKVDRALGDVHEPRND
jgi:hypothetical protein